MMRSSPIALVRCFVCFFKQKTADESRIRDWSSDVCSSDLLFSRRIIKAWVDDPRGAPPAEVPDLYRLADPRRATLNQRHRERTAERRRLDRRCDAALRRADPCRVRRHDMRAAFEGTARSDGQPTEIRSLMGIV